MGRSNVGAWGWGMSRGRVGEGGGVVMIANGERKEYRRNEGRNRAREGMK